MMHHSAVYVMLARRLVNMRLVEEVLRLVLDESHKAGARSVKA